MSAMQMVARRRVVGEVDLKAYSVTGTGPTISFTMASNGTTSGDASGWYTPTQAGAGSGLWVILTPTGGTLPISDAAVGSRLSLASDLTWTGTNSVGIKFKSFEVEIWSESSGGTLIDSGTLYLEIDAT